MNDNQEVKIGMTDGDDSQELKPSCAQAKAKSYIVRQITVDIHRSGILDLDKSSELAEHLYQIGYRS